jgi:3-phosphoglycerate kinase
LKKKTLRDVDLGGRRLLMRVDFNVPLSRDGDISDDTRIRAALPSIEYAAKQGAAIVLMSHLGRPKGVVNPSLSLEVIAYRLGDLVEYPVKFVADCVGEAVERNAAALKPGEIMLLENLRFNPGETANDPAFSEQLARCGDLYANDAFGTAHRAHASTVGVTEHFEERVAGFLMEKEITTLTGLLTEPERPFVAVLGGAKVSSKIHLIENLLNRVDRIAVGGGMAFSFINAAGLEIGKSILEEEYVLSCRKIMEKTDSEGRKRLLLPVDCIVAQEMEAGAEHKTVSTGDIPEEWIGVDIGEKTVEVFGRELRGAKTIFWNGPMGVFEVPEFANGTRKIAKIIAVRTGEGATSVVGGGDSIAALNQINLTESITHVSTGGGASLELLEGKNLPGVEVLTDSE